MKLHTAKDELDGRQKIVKKSIHSIIYKYMTIADKI